MKPTVKLIAVTVGAGELRGKSGQEVITHNARVSNPANQKNFDTAAGLLKFCIREGHWSIFEQADMTVEINTTRGIAAQILRHRSFCFQEFSQRYADTKLLTDKLTPPDLRRQDTKNRQNSIDDFGDYVKLGMQAKIREHFAAAQQLYDSLLSQGVAKECARFVLPLATPTRIYMKGSVRSWLHYLQLRSGNGTQKEHREVAEAIKCIFICEYPDVSKAMEWEREEECPECLYQSMITLE
ncbi:FAD-dependent thymidylate synthase [bacterium]|nr:FAD-dependent thymidylate synthase [bacterium]